LKRDAVLLSGRGLRNLGILAYGMLPVYPGVAERESVRNSHKVFYSSVTESICERRSDGGDIKATKRGETEHQESGCSRQA
jgi:hypothetical protein